MVTDESQSSSFGEGQALVNQCRKLCEDLLANLAEFPKAWEIINSSAIGEFGSLERAPAIAAYCGLFGIHCQISLLAELMLVALLADIGMIKLEASITKKIRQELALDDRERKAFERLPEMSLNTILDRKFSIDEKSRGILLSTYEHADGSGFPKGITELKLGAGAQMVRLARDFDRATILRLGKARQDPKIVMRDYVSQAQPGKIFTRDFIHLLTKNLLKTDIFQ